MARMSREKEARKERALERIEMSNQRTPEEQLQRLDDMFGEGQGASKERLKLAMKIEDRNRPSQSKEKVEDKPVRYRYKSANQSAELV